MNAIEDRLRDAYRAAADTVGPDSVPALTDQPAPGRAGTGSGGTPPTPGQRWRRLAIPVAAAAAVSLITATVWLARPDGSRPSGGPALGPGGPAAAPPFIVGSPDSSDAGLTVYRATTGQVLASVPAPGHGLDFYHTAATSNDHSFIVAAARTKGGCYTLFYRLQLTRSGGLASLTRLAVPRAHNLMAYGLAASADGKTIAYTAGPCDGGHGQVSVARVGSQTVRTWSLKAEGALSPSLSPDGRMLYFLSNTVLGGDGTVRALRTDAPPGPAARRARVVLGRGADLGEEGAIALARGGRVLLTCSIIHQSAILGSYSLATGRLSRVHAWQHATAGPCTIAATPDGSRALLSAIVPGIGTRVDLATGLARPLPGHAIPPPSGLSW